MRLRTVGAFTLLVVAAVAINVEARADGPADAFGHHGHLAISSDADLSLTRTTVSGVGGTTILFLKPSVDYFVIDKLSIGGFVPFEYATGGNFTTTIIGIGARVGYDIPLAERFSFWPRAGMSFASATTSTTSMVNGASTSASNSNSALTLDLYAPFLFHPAEHFFLGVGPRLDVGLTGDNKATVYGLTFIVGGYFLGD